MVAGANEDNDEFMTNTNRQTPTLIHPGYPKTGTTFLQKAIFKDKSLFRILWSIDEINRHIVRPNELHFNMEEARRALGDAQASIPPSLVDVISSENLVGNPLFGARDSVQMIERLKSLFPAAKILLTVRAQPSMAKSIYIQYVKRGGLMKPEQFFDQKLTPGYYGFEPNFLEYHWLVEKYAELFGENNVLVLPQEFLLSERDRFLSILLSFCFGKDSAATLNIPPDKRIGVSPPLSGLPLMRFGNRFREDALNPGTSAAFSWLGRIAYKIGYRQKLFASRYDRQMNSLIERIFNNQFAGSNIRLQKFCPVDLESFGFDLGDR